MNNNLFGTDGIRAKVGKSPFTLHSLSSLGHAIGSWIFTTYGKKARILIGQDTRASGDWIIANLSTGLLLHPLELHLAGVLPTPSICRLLQQSSAYDVGIIISASHNPYQDNGIKIINHATEKLTKNDEHSISNLYYKKKNVTYRSYGSLHYYIDAFHHYLRDITSLFPPSFLKGIKIVIDCAHGATYQLAPVIFTALGADVITLNAKPNGKNINKNCGSLYVHDVQQAVLTHNASIGFAFDGDGDRVITINKQGAIKNGDDMLALLSQHASYTKQQTIVGTIMSNLGLDRYFHRYNKLLVRTKVGDKYITDYMKTHNLLLGGEQSGHIILHDYLPIGDGIFTALRICEIMITTTNWNLDTFDHYPQIIVNIPVTTKKDLTDPTIVAIIKDHESQLTGGRLVIRYSGTENMLRIMIEDQNKAVITQVGANLAHQLQQYLQ